MRRGLVVIVGLMLVSGVASAQVVLDADFDDKTIDAPIGTGGAVVGEPISDGFPQVLATVRATPFASPCLEVQDNDDFSAGSVRFNFLADEEVTTGTVVISMDLWIDAFDEFNIFVREPTFASASFTTLTLNDSGDVYVSDADNGGNVLVGSYAIGRAMPLTMTFDMDAGTYDIELDGQPRVDGDTHGVVGRGVGSVGVGLGSDANLVGTIWVDNLTVTKIDPVFADGFESGDTTAWSSSTP